MQEEQATRSQLDDVLPDYDSILKAPNRFQLEMIARQRGVDIEDVLSAERKKQYKSVDLATGNIYLIQNPAAWLQVGNKFVRPKPQFQCSLSQARSYAGARPVKKGRAAVAAEAF